MLYLLEKERGKGVFTATFVHLFVCNGELLHTTSFFLLYILLLTGLSPPSLFLSGVSGESFRGALRVFERKSS
jgi:hypothetical protein